MNGGQPDLQFQPLTPDRWRDFETLFGPSGAYGGCWCMWPRLRRKEFDRNSGKQNRQAMKEAVDSGEEPGLLAYSGGEPVGWVALAPRERYAHLEHSRTLKRVDDQPVWSIACFVVDKRARGGGMMAKLLSAAVDYAARRGATIVEGYPAEPQGKLSGYAGYTGIVSTFRKAGFVEVARRSEGQPIMRFYSGGTSQA
ncbi:MAG: GCN5-related N-acetyltransferase [Dehalococcoidia bacterium]|nr:GCN5-related N-acetyltransferase [Dehalococcoidia bacterium]